MEGVIRLFLSPVDEVRNGAEAHIEAARKADKDALAVALINVVRTCQDSDVRQTAAVLLRKILVVSDVKIWHALRPDVQLALQQELLNVLQAETVKKIRMNVCDLVAAIAADVAETARGGDSAASGGGEKSWPALWALVQSAVTAPNPDVQEIGFTLVERLSAEVGCHMPHALASFQQLFVARLTDPALPLFLRLAVARAAAGVFMFIVKAEHRKAFAAVLGPMLNSLQMAVAAGEEEASETLSGLLAEITEDEDVAPLFKPILPRTVELLSSITANTAVHNPTRANCLLVLVNIAEHAPSVARNMAPGKGAFIAALIPLCFQLATEWGLQEEDCMAKWDQGDQESDAMEENAEGCNVDLGLDSLARLHMALGSEHVRGTFLSVAERLRLAAAGPAEWMKRYALMNAFAECPEVIDDEREQQEMFAKQVCGAVVSDPHPRVRQAAVTTVINVVDLQSPTFQESTHATTMPALIQALQDPCRRVRTQACHAVAAYCLPLDAMDVTTSLEPYSSTLMQTLVGALNSVGSGRAPADRRLREASIGSLTMISVAMGDKAGTYYDALRDGLLSILSSPEPPAPVVGGDSPEQRAARQEAEKALFHARLMKGKALECLSVTGAAAGKERFHADALACLGGVVSMLQAMEAEKGAAAAQEAAGAPGASSATENPFQSYIWDAVGRLAKVLGQDQLAAYLPTILPPLLNAASASTTVSAVEHRQDDEEEEEEEEEEEDDGGYHVIERGDGTMIKVRTAELEDKVSALGALGTLFTEMNQAQVLAGGGKVGGRSILFNVAPSALAVMRKSVAESGYHLEELRRTAVDMADELFMCLASGLTSTAVQAAAVEIAAAGGVLPPALAGSPPHVYVDQLHGLAKDIAKAVYDEVDGSVDVECGFVNHLLNSLKQVMGTASFRSAFPGELAGHALPDTGRYLCLFPTPVMEVIIQHLVLTLRRVYASKVRRLQEEKVKAAEDELDEVEAEAMLKKKDDDDDLLLNIGEALGLLLKLGGSPITSLTHCLPAAVPMAPLFSCWAAFKSSVLPEYQPWAMPGAEPHDLAKVVSLAVDILDLVGDELLVTNPAEGGQMLSMMFPLVIDGLLPEHSVVARQASAYACGSMSGKLHSLWPRFLIPAFERCARILAETNREVDGQLFDTAGSALLLMLVRCYPVVSPGLVAQPGFVPRSSGLPTLFSYLPFVADMIEAKNAAEVIVDLVMARDGDAFGQGDWAGSAQACLLSSLRQFASVLGLLNDEEVVSQPHGSDSALHAKIAGCLSWMQSSGWVPAPVLQRAIDQLDAGDKGALAEAMRVHHARAAAAPAISAQPTSPRQ